MPRVKSTVVYNCLTDDFMKRAEAYLSSKSPKAGQFTVLMLCTLKEYKGVNEYVKLAGLLPDFRFVLVLSTPYEEVLRHFDGQELPDNLVLFPVQRSVHSFYQEAHVVLNLSHPVDCMEAFGMTLLEGMSYGLPVIGPPVGGPAELVKDGYNGYSVDQRNLPMLVQKLRELQEMAGNYHLLSANARAFAERFSERQFAGELVRVVGLS